MTAVRRGVVLRQTYVRLAKAASIKASRYAHAKQFKRMRRQLRKLKTWLGRVTRDIRRKVPKPGEALEDLLTLCERLHQQQKQDTRMRRCFLKGLAGDEINAILAAAGLNLRKLLRGFIFTLIFWLSPHVDRRFGSDRHTNHALTLVQHHPNRHAPRENEPRIVAR